MARKKKQTKRRTEKEIEKLKKEVESLKEKQAAIQLIQKQPIQTTQNSKEQKKSELVITDNKTQKVEEKTEIEKIKRNYKISKRHKKH